MSRLQPAVRGIGCLPPRRRPCRSRSEAALDDEPSAPLGHPEGFGVQHLAVDRVAECFKTYDGLTQDDLAAEPQASDVLENEMRWTPMLHEVHELEEQPVAVV